LDCLESEEEFYMGEMTSRALTDCLQVDSKLVAFGAAGLSGLLLMVTIEEVGTRGKLTCWIRLFKSY